MGVVNELSYPKLFWNVWRWRLLDFFTIQESNLLSEWPIWKYLAVRLSPWAMESSRCTREYTSFLGWLLSLERERERRKRQSGYIDYQTNIANWELIEIRNILADFYSWIVKPSDNNRWTTCVLCWFFRMTKMSSRQMTSWRLRCLGKLMICCNSLVNISGAGPRPKASSLVRILICMRLSRSIKN